MAEEALKGTVYGVRGNFSPSNGGRAYGSRPVAMAPETGQLQVLTSPTHGKAWTFARRFHVGGMPAEETLTLYNLSGARGVMVQLMTDSANYLAEGQAAVTISIPAVRPATVDAPGGEAYPVDLPAVRYGWIMLSPILETGVSGLPSPHFMTMGAELNSFVFGPGAPLLGLTHFSSSIPHVLAFSVTYPAPVGGGYHGTIVARVW